MRWWPPAGPLAEISILLAVIAMALSVIVVPGISLLSWSARSCASILLVGPTCLILYALAVLFDTTVKRLIKGIIAEAILYVIAVALYMSSYTLIITWLVFFLDC